MHNYKLRQQVLLDKLDVASVAIIFGAKIINRNSDSQMLFRQHSDILYLTGFNEPDCCLVLTKDYSGKSKVTMFLQPKDPIAECWNGKRLGIDEGIKVLGLDAAFPLCDLEKHLTDLCANKQNLYYSFSANTQNDLCVLKTLEIVKQGMRRGAQAPDTIRDLSLLLHEQRLIKDDYEKELMYQAASISAKAHNKLIKACKPGLFEYQLEAIFTHHVQYNGCRTLAYPAIVATGANACILHYTNNEDELKDGDLLLIDAGGEYKGYSADITRTFPVNGKFTSAQKDIYELVLRAQLAGIDAVKIGLPLNGVQDSILEVMIPGLIDLKILTGNKDDILKNQSYKKVYMHGSGHWLGLDTHDVGRYKLDNNWRDFEPGMVITVEPGLYIPEDSNIPSQYHNIGVRIEDDVFVGKNGPVILSEEVPKTISEIEAMMAS
ncbi:MAG: M24 family metallopeptidase [Francisellaceae bacterium]|nr:M24 family metallopeptidase [Francisellaceae bacterium]MBT6539920.1 M24 family metallopeptidase [Francisellaceae bacterium]